ncbi:MAG TPA: hypothetical protein DCW31_07110 [Lactobacillus sp.]|nr:hypothetical protein [Lactobacillus sp.]
MADEQQRRHDMIAAINETIVREGFATLKMDQIAKIMGVSRGKLYQYYPSKDAVIEAVVARYRDFMKAQAIKQYKKGADILNAFPQTFLNAVTLIGSNSSAFRQDLAHFYPDMYLTFNTDYRKWLTGLTAFLSAGQQANVFNSNLNPALFVIQTEATVPALMDIQTLTERRLFIDDVLRDYFKMIISEIVIPEKQATVDLHDVAEPLDHLIAKYQRAFD